MTPSHTKTIFKSTTVRDENHQVMPYSIEKYRLNILDKFIKHVYSSACFYVRNLQAHFWLQCASENYSNFCDSCNILVKICLVFLYRVTVVAL